VISFRAWPSHSRTGDVKEWLVHIACLEPLLDFMPSEAFESGDGASFANPLSEERETIVAEKS